MFRSYFIHYIHSLFGISLQIRDLLCTYTICIVIYIVYLKGSKQRIIVLELEDKLMGDIKYLRSHSVKELNNFVISSFSV